MGDSLDVAHRFGENLRRVRRQTDISQEEVSFRAGLHRTEVGLLERGARVPRIDTLMKLCAALGVRIDCALLDGIAWRSSDITTTPGGFKFTPQDGGRSKGST